MWDDLVGSRHLISKIQLSNTILLFLSFFRFGWGSLEEKLFIFLEEQEVFERSVGVAFILRACIGRVLIGSSEITERRLKMGVGILRPSGLMLSSIYGASVVVLAMIGLGGGRVIVRLK